MQKKSISINLLKDKGGFLDKFIAWALTFGRVLVILTEGVALGAFLYRFSLDREIIDLKDAIHQKAEHVALFKNSEAKYRTLQDQIALVSAFQDEGPKTTTLFTDVVNANGSNLTIRSVALASEKIKINANASSVTAVSTYIEKLKNHKDIAFVSLDKIENRALAQTIAVTITATLKKQQTKIQTK